MKMNAMQEEYQTVELFGNPALYSNGRIDRSTVPEGWYAYDLRGSDYDPGDPVTIEDHVLVNHAATILTQTPIRYPEGKDFLPLGEELNFADSTIMTLTEFCEENGLPAPASSQKYTLHPAHSNEAGLFYGLTPEQDEELGAIGHLRIDFGNNGREWWSSWHPRGPQELNTSEFRLELDELVNELRRDGSLLHDLRDMGQYCHSNGGEIEGGWRQNYGYEVETEKYLYRIRCSPGQGDYHCYLSCFDKHQQELMQSQPLVGQLTFGNGDIQRYTNAEEFLKAVKEELPYHPTSGLKIEVLTNDPQTRKAVDDMLYDLYGEQNPKQIEDYKAPEEDTLTVEMKM
nr:LPD28 domain-containing protein [uncultured Dysosmobacter sp.]